MAAAPLYHDASYPSAAADHALAASSPFEHAAAQAGADADHSMRLAPDFLLEEAYNPFKEAIATLQNITPENRKALTGDLAAAVDTLMDEEIKIDDDETFWEEMERFRNNVQKYMKDEKGGWKGLFGRTYDATAETVQDLAASAVRQSGLAHAIAQQLLPEGASDADIDRAVDKFLGTDLGGAVQETAAALVVDAGAGEGEEVSLRRASLNISGLREAILFALMGLPFALLFGMSERQQQRYQAAKTKHMTLRRMAAEEDDDDAADKATALMNAFFDEGANVPEAAPYVPGRQPLPNLWLDDADEEDAKATERDTAPHAPPPSGGEATVRTRRTRRAGWDGENESGDEFGDGGGVLHPPPPVPPRPVPPRPEEAHRQIAEHLRRRIKDEQKDQEEEKAATQPMLHRPLGLRGGGGDGSDSSRTSSLKRAVSDRVASLVATRSAGSLTVGPKAKDAIAAVVDATKADLAEFARDLRDMYGSSVSNSRAIIDELARRIVTDPRFPGFCDPGKRCCPTRSTVTKGTKDNDRRCKYRNPKTKTQCKNARCVGMFHCGTHRAQPVNAHARLKAQTAKNKKKRARSPSPPRPADSNVFSRDAVIQRAREFHAKRTGGRALPPSRVAARASSSSSSSSWNVDDLIRRAQEIKRERLRGGKRRRRR